MRQTKKHTVWCVFCLEKPNSLDDSNSNEISHFVRCEIIYFVNCEIENWSFLWNKINPLSHAVGVFHIAKQYFTPEGYFTNPERIYFVEKATCQNKLLFPVHLLHFAFASGSARFGQKSRFSRFLSTLQKGSLPCRNPVRKVRQIKKDSQL